MDQYDSELDAMDKFGDRYLALPSMERSKSRVSGLTSEYALLILTVESRLLVWP